MSELTTIDVRDARGRVTFRLRCPPGLVGMARSLLTGRYDLSGIPEPHRILDIGAGVGAFAIWAWSQWSRAWVDCYEPDPDLAALCAEHLPPGGAMLTQPPEYVGDYDLVRFARPGTHYPRRPRGQLTYLVDYQERP